jgi:hypothetical protein
MELPGSGYFYALAALSMAFVGFTAIVVVLRQGKVNHSRHSISCLPICLSSWG